MKNLKFIAVLIFSFIFFNLFVRGVWAVPPKPWVDNDNACGVDQIAPEDLNIVNNRSNLVQALRREGVCSKRDDIEINDFDTTGNIGISYCDLSAGEVTPRNPKGDALHGKCCPSTHPNSQKNQSGVCCHEGYYPHFFGSVNCYDENNEKDLSADPWIGSFSAHTDSETADSEPLVPGTGPLYTCPIDGCLLDRGGSLVPNTTEDNPITSAETENYKCIEPKTQNDANDQQLCLAGEWVSAEELASSDLLHVVKQCSQLRDDAQREDCFKCFAKNLDADNRPKSPQTYVYSSLGCIDTNRDPFITRLFQIGFGTLGSLAVARIMWGSVKRQSTDPAKIQEGWDLILAALASLFMLAATFPLLRYIGINVTGLLPVDFFN